MAHKINWFSKELHRLRAKVWPVHLVAFNWEFPQLLAYSGIEGFWG